MNIFSEEEKGIPMHNKFASYILHNNHLPQHNSILLTLSGGQDSLCLLKLIIDFQNYYRWKIGLVHFDHKYRKDAYHNIKQVLNIAKFLRIKTYLYEHKIKHNSEAEDREWRYKNTIYIASYYKYSTIITGHTKTDQSETFLQHFLRGCGIDSFSNISFKTRITYQITIIRPLIIFSRSETLWLSKKFNLPIWSDFTNYEYKIRRNRLREELLPYLQQYFQPRIHNIIQAISDKAKIDSEYLQKATIKLYFLVKHPKFISINFYLLSKQPKALQYRIFKLFFKHNFNIQITKKNIENIIKITQNINSQLSYIICPKLGLHYAHNWLFILN